MSSYKQILDLANELYDKAREKAEVRDLSGAVECLQESLKLNRQNISSRNLLGLIYWEMGEAGEALAQWVLSQNIQPNDNPANEYLEDIRRHPGKLEQMSRALHKYNLSLEYAREGSLDLALIQARRVVQMSPHLVKARKLLALLYMQQDDLGKALKMFRKVLAIDRSDTMALRFLQQIRRDRIAVMPESARRTGRQKVQVEEFADAPDEVIIPKTRGGVSGVLAAVMLVLGIAAGLLCYHLLLYPTRLARINQGNNERVALEVQKQEDQSGELRRRDKEIANLNARISELEAGLDNYTSSDGVLHWYETLISAYRSCLADEYGNAADTLALLPEEALEEPGIRTGYDELKTLFANRAKELYTEAVNLFNGWDYSHAVRSLTEALKLDPEYPDAIYLIGACYYELGDPEAGKPYFEKIIKDYPDAGYTEVIQAYMAR